MMRPQGNSVWLFFFSTCSLVAGCKVRLRNGATVEGTQGRSISGKDVWVYYGIPYGRPPVGNLRFRPPVPVDMWNGTLRAMDPSLSPQQEVPDDLAAANRVVPRPWTEDCLKLHIWVPQNAPNSGQDPRGYPVIAYIHGGEFVSENALWDIDGSNFAADEGMIFVSIEYRLGVFGFLHLGHQEAPGNVGLLDQQLALRWIKQNIQAFGGDSDRVTIMGNNAGSASVGYHLLSRGSRGLFQRAIMMSGVPTNTWAYSTPANSLILARKLLDTTSCTKDTISNSIVCLRRKRPDELLRASHTKHLMASRQFVPTVDGTFLERSPYEAREIQNPADVLVGSTTDEGTEFLILLKQDLAYRPNYGITLREFESLVRQLYPAISEREALELSTIYRNGSSQDDARTLFDAARNLFADGLFCCDINKFADMLSTTGSRKVYRYVYDHMVAPFWFPTFRWFRSVHRSDKATTVGSPRGFETPQDEAARIRLVKHFANFVRTGNPNLKRSNYRSEPEWPTYKSNTRQYNFIGSYGSRVQNNPRIQECMGWHKIQGAARRTNTNNRPSNRPGIDRPTTKRPSNNRPSWG